MPYGVGHYATTLKPWAAGEVCGRCQTQDNPKRFRGLCTKCFRKDQDERRAKYGPLKIGGYHSPPAWSRRYTECRLCGNTNQRHISFGYCVACRYTAKKLGIYHHPNTTKVGYTLVDGTRHLSPRAEEPMAP